MDTQTFYATLTEFLLDSSLLVAHIVGFVGVLIMAYGGLRSGYMFILCVTKKLDHLLPRIRIELAKYLTLGLEFLVGKDIIETIIEPSWEELGKLAVIIILRTVVTFFLSWELKEAIEEVEQEAEMRKLMNQQSEE